MRTTAVTVQPNNWLKELTRLQPAQWSWGQAIRAVLSIVLPLAIGLTLNNVSTYLWIAMGAMLQVSGERNTPYHILRKKLVITAPLAACGFLLGYLSVLPWALVVVIMTCLAFISCIVSSYSSALSIGTMQMLMMGTVALGNPDITNYITPAISLIFGGVFYFILLTIEHWIYPHRIQHNVESALLSALLTLTKNRQDETLTEKYSQAVTTHIDELYTVMFSLRSHSASRSQATEQLANTIHQAQLLFSRIIANKDPHILQITSQQLTQALQAFNNKQKRPAAYSGPDLALLSNTESFIDCLWNVDNTQISALKLSTTTPPKVRQRFSAWVATLSVSKGLLLSAFSLAICTALAYSLRLEDNKSHWYWIPMTVFLVIKPDMGSVFNRTVLRCIGTSLGVIIGATILYTLPSGPLFLSALGVLALILPWASQRSYAMLSLILTPIVLSLIDLVSPEIHGVNYSLLRLEDTIIGGAIAFVFGYLIWPKTHKDQLNHSFTLIRQSLATYLAAVTHQDNSTDPIIFNNTLRSTRHHAYVQLASMRTQLQKLLAEPPPANQEALAWYPLISSANRICNGITIYSMYADLNTKPKNSKLIDTLIEVLKDNNNLNTIINIDTSTLPTTVEGHLITIIVDELNHVHSLINDQQTLKNPPKITHQKTALH